MRAKTKKITDLEYLQRFEQKKTNRDFLILLLFSFDFEFVIINSKLAILHVSSEKNLN